MMHLSKDSLPCPAAAIGEQTAISICRTRGFAEVSRRVLTYETRANAENEAIMERMVELAMDNCG